MKKSKQKDLRRFYDTDRKKLALQVHIPPEELYIMSLLNKLKDMWNRSQTPEALERVYVTLKDRGGHTHMLNDSKCAMLIGAQSRAFHTPVLEHSDTPKSDSDSSNEVFIFQ